MKEYVIQTTLGAYKEAWKVLKEAGILGVIQEKKVDADTVIQVVCKLMDSDLINRFCAAAIGHGDPDYFDAWEVDDLRKLVTDFFGCMVESFPELKTLQEMGRQAPSKKTSSKNTSTSSPKSDSVRRKK